MHHVVPLTAERISDDRIEKLTTQKEKYDKTTLTCSEIAAPWHLRILQTTTTPTALLTCR